ncbi:hypothetical protein CEXT_679141 [Caerostris extrusa]|uniref:Uncharacterized protein n=1 Tax=Caerostris extrusa TaxID=172846 RepID=A0AAV4ST47_CAEEX|nr:hypothetical protein CEXT_679141 [Caerostris extrusa]
MSVFLKLTQVFVKLRVLEKESSDDENASLKITFRAEEIRRRLCLTWQYRTPKFSWTFFRESYPLHSFWKRFAFWDLDMNT